MSFTLARSHVIAYLTDWYREHPNCRGFSQEGLEAIAAIADEIGTPREVSPIQLACEWEEFETVDALREHLVGYTGYSTDLGDEALLEWVNVQTICLPFEFGVQTRYVLAQF
jgi:hypothetical protein